MDSPVPRIENSLVSTMCAGFHKFSAGLLDVGSQYSLVTKDTALVGVRMLLKLLIAAAWAVLFIIFYRFSSPADPFIDLELICR